MAGICVGSIKICALRVTLLDSVGNVVGGPNNYVSTILESQLQFTGVVDKGKDLFYRDGCDRPLSNYKSPELLRRFDLQVDFYALEPAVQSLMLAAPILSDGSGNAVGFEYAMQDCPTDPQPPNTAIEAWSWSWQCDSQVAATPYWYYLWPSVQWSTDQAQILQTDLLQPKLTGFTRRNPVWGHGPFGGIVKGAAGGPTYQSATGGGAVFLTSTPPPAAVCGFGTVSPSS
jgi:hypothetical protein